MYWLQQAWIFTRQKKKKSIPIVMKTCFSEEKLMKQFATPPPFSKRTPPFSTNSPISEQFFHDPPLYPNFKNKKPSLILGGGGEKLWKPTHLSFYYIDFTYRHSVIWDNSIFLEADSSSFSVIRMICSNMIIIIPMLPCEGYCHHQMMVESKKCQTQMSYL